MNPEQSLPTPSWPTEWPKVARNIADATADALAAVRAANSGALTDAVDELKNLSFEQVSSVHAAIVRELLEDTHPDGLSSEDVQDALTACAKATITWLPDLDVQALAAVYTGALGISDLEDDSFRIGHGAYLRSAVLVMGSLSAGTKKPQATYIATAIGEIARAQTIEMP
ncbi:hypothetical protein [Rhodococcus sp. ARC_M6]|uniref:hypothetical protein n=1 Tax=Rhodococcus sp. ARC_M6 TaxID=2928852 RepID=UPI001FB321B7|nr:hypothetical protein [Rhodococcus sp. ARC_M6]MCJ0906422.1 hypothetical protein [Rhodococcus sp. ARC_M6]